MFRCCVRWRGYRTAAAFIRARLLYSGSVQDEMLRHVSSDAAVCFKVTPELRVGDGSLLPPQKAGAEELQGDGQAACRLESRGQPTQMSNRSSGNSIWGGTIAIQIFVPFVSANMKSLVLVLAEVRRSFLSLSVAAWI